MLLAVDSSGGLPILGVAVPAEVEGVKLIECLTTPHAELAKRPVEGPLPTAPPDEELPPVHQPVIHGQQRHIVSDRSLL